MTTTTTPPVEEGQDWRGVAADGELIRVDVTIDVRHLIVSNARLVGTGIVWTHRQRGLVNSRAAQVLVQSVALNILPPGNQRIA